MKHTGYIIFFFMLILTSCERINFEEEESGSIHVFESFWYNVDTRFSFFDYIPLDWDSVYNEYRTKIDESTGQYKLYSILSEMINLLKDGHSNILTTFGTSRYPFSMYFKVNMLNDISQYFSYYSVLNDVFDYGVLSSNNIGYIKVKTFSNQVDVQQYEQIDFILNTLINTKSIIIDVRSNGGGSSMNSDIIAEKFNDQQRFVLRYREKTGPEHNDFSEWKDIYLDACNCEITNKPVAVLTNRWSFSATERFVASMDVIPNVTIVGDTTGGGSGTPKICELPNGWIIRVSGTQVQLPSGRDYQYTGLYPDIPVWFLDEDSINNIDRILETAVNHLYNL